MIINENNGYYRTRIIETKNEFYSKYSPLQIIDFNCVEYGASFKGRCKTVHRILNSKSKIPIPIHPKGGIFFLPTVSMKNDNFVLISFFHVKEYVGIEKETYVTFENDMGYYITTSVRQFDLQMKRTSQVITYFLRLYFLDYFKK